MQKEELIWSYGEKPQRSLRRQCNVTIHRCLAESDDMLQYTEDDWRKSTKREETYNKIAEREMIGQRGYNPYNPANNYFENLLEHENYVKDK